MAAYIVRGKGYRAGDVLTGMDVDRIAVHCDAPLPLQADGEDLGDVETAVFEAMRDAVSFLSSASTSTVRLAMAQVTLELRRVLDGDRCPARSPRATCSSCTAAWCCCAPSTSAR